MVHDGGECNNSYTYKSNSSKYTALLSKTVETDKGKTVYDATVQALSENNIPYTEKNGYISSIGGFAEFDHGENSGWMYKVNGEHQNVGCKDVVLSENATVLWFYTDDYTRESGSEKYSKPSNAEKTEADKAKADAEETQIAVPQKRVFTDSTFSDVKESDWHYEAVKYVYENNLMSGTGENFEPDGKMTRAMLVCVLFRLSGEEFAETGMIFDDVPSGEWYSDGILWAASVGIVSGVGDNRFAPDGEVTREQMAVILYNFANYKNQIEQTEEKDAEFEDFGEVSDYAKTAILWANSAGFISGESETRLNPKGTATRAQIASLLMRYCEAEVSE